MLSKSRIMRGVKCHKSLWLNKHAINLREISTGQEAIFQAGTDIGILAQKKFPNGIDATKGHDYPNKICFNKTMQFIENGEKVIYEATFIYNNVLVAIDILEKEGDFWNIYEVKSSTKAKPEHTPDVAIQKYVAEGCGLQIKNVYITHINNQYYRKGDLDVHQLFTSTNITKDVANAFENLPQTIEELEKIQKLKTCPTIKIGNHCNNPYPCDFMNVCWKNEKYLNINELSRGGKKINQLLEMGITDLKDIPTDFKLTKNQKIQVHAEKTNEVLIKKDLIKQFVRKLQYPLYFLDFETINPAIPPFDYTKPYGQSVFQYSVHIQHEENGPVVHHEYLAPTDGKDYRQEMIKKLLKDCGSQGSVLVYNKSFEKGRIIELANISPLNKKALLNLNQRIIDLATPFQKKAYYTKEMKGKYTIKKVLPALAPNLSYNDLKIGDGGTASNTFYTMFENRFKGNIDETKTALIEYCKMDTYAMVVLLAKLKEVL